MKPDIERQVEELLDIESQEILINKVAEITDESVLYALSYSYNWDDGFAVPEAIINNPNCHLSTALAIFYLADGVSYLKDKQAVEKSSLEWWKRFIVNLYDRIVNGEFERSCIGFASPLGKVEIYKLKRELDMSEHIFLKKIEEKSS